MNDWRRGPFTLFDFWRRPGWRLDAEEGPRSRLWYLAATASLLAGFWFEWEDIVGGASLTRIVTIWIVVSGVCFYFLTRFVKTAFWLAAIAAVSGILAFGLESKEWLANGEWPGWTIRYFFDVAGLQDVPQSSNVVQLYDYSLIGGLTVLALLALVAGVIADRLGKIEAERRRSAAGDADNGDVNNNGEEDRK